MISISEIVLVGAGGFLAALGLAVALLQRDRVGLIFAAFCIGFGVGFANAGAARSMEYVNWRTAGPTSDFITGAAYALIAAGAIGLAVIVPKGAQQVTRANLVIAGLAGSSLAIAGYLALTPFHATRTLAALNGLYLGAIIFAIVLLPLRFGAQPLEATRSRRTLALLAAGIALILAGQGGDLVVAARSGQLVGLEVVATLALVLPGVLWLGASRGPDSRLARNVALMIPGVVLLAMLIPGGTRAFYYGPGLVAGALLLAYAVLRGEIEGLDLKVRFALSKSTIAAVFIAVFFVASETAQQFFGDTLGSTYVGIAAAGMLVFAMAPLQRVAERLAEKAVPVSAPARPTPSPTGANPAAYCAAVQLALSDGVIDRADERRLASLAAALGLDPEEAWRIREQTETEGGA